jgi:hypothetical protein
LELLLLQSYYLVHLLIRIFQFAAVVQVDIVVPIYCSFSIHTPFAAEYSKVKPSFLFTVGTAAFAVVEV